jgi:hypothetical protein
MTAQLKLNNDAKMNNDAKFGIVSSCRGDDPAQNSEIFVGRRVRVESAQLDRLPRKHRLGDISR